MSAEAPPLLRGLPPIVDERSRVLILGSFPSEESLRRQQYYAFSRNQFWPIMGRLFSFDPRTPYESRVQALGDNRVAVWDVIATCERRGSADQAIRAEELNDLAALIDDHRIRHIAFNGGKSFETARKRLPELFSESGVMCHRMPSTSPAHAGMTFAAKVEAWSRLLEWLRP